MGAKVLAQLRRVHLAVVLPQPGSKHLSTAIHHASRNQGLYPFGRVSAQRLVRHLASAGQGHMLLATATSCATAEGCRSKNLHLLGVSTSLRRCNRRAAVHAATLWTLSACHGTQLSRSLTC